MVIPTECKMPDLSDCFADRLLGRSLLHAYLLGDPGVTAKGKLYRRDFVRLVDKAIYEYQQARQAILNQIAEAERSYEQMVQEGRRIFIFDYVNHFENCLNAINRALILLESMNREPVVSNLPKILRRTLEAHSRLLPDMRNAFEHIEDRIRDGMADGQSVMLYIGDDGDRASIGPHEVEFVDVARTLRKLHEIGKQMFDNEQIEAAMRGGEAVIGRQGEESLGQ